MLALETQTACPFSFIIMAVLILGCRAPNNIPPPMMTKRVELGVELYKDLVEKNSQLSKEAQMQWRMILTGYTGNGQTLSEGAVMKRLAVDSGVDEQNVLLEEEARNTVENAYFSKLIIDQLGINEIHVVSSSFHIPRCKVIFGTFYHEKCYAVCYHEAFEEITEERRAKEAAEMSTVHENIHQCITRHAPKEKPLIFKSPVLNLDGIVHGFTCRLGGVSRYRPLSSLNLHFNPVRRDPEICVRENYKRIAAVMDLDVNAFRNPKAVHGRDIWVIGDAQPDSYDGVLTDQAGVVITAPGADCMPVLLCDPVCHVIAACHSGWRGTVLQIASHAVEIMTTRFSCDSKNIRVAVGPSIGPCCYEVDDEVAKKFDDAFVITQPKWRKPHVDLWGCLFASLQKCGISEDNMDVPRPWKETQGHFTSTITYCTQCDPEDRFFSHRRHGIQFGTQRGIIMMT